MAHTSESHESSGAEGQASIGKVETSQCLTDWKQRRRLRSSPGYRVTGKGHECALLCASAADRTLHTQAGESVFPSQHWLPAHAGGATLVSAAGERKWARVLARAQHPSGLSL